MDFNVYNFDYNNRIRNLDIEAKGIVKSTKYFPVFNIDNEEYIFKPLSKTKPYSTPFFGISEVFWSNIINKYFDNNTEIYRLGICKNNDNPKYHEHGTFVKSLINNNQKLINLYEYFNNNDKVNIKDYINYCGIFYDYTFVLNSDLFNDEKLGRQLSFQILLSLLKGDINYHYENVLLIEENKKYKLATSLDHEFSLFFLYIDHYFNHINTCKAFFDILRLKHFNSFYLANTYNIIKNIDIIYFKYNDVVQDFIEKLDNFISDFSNKSFNIPNSNYFYPFSSYDYEIGIERYKNHNEEKALELEKEIKRVEVNMEQVSYDIQCEVLENALLLKKLLESYTDNKTLKLAK